MGKPETPGGVLAWAGKGEQTGHTEGREGVPHICV